MYACVCVSKWPPVVSENNTTAITSTINTTEVRVLSADGCGVMLSEIINKV